MKELLSQLAALQQKPAPFTPGEPLFWDDPHISAHMLAAHLDPDFEAASRPPEIIDRSVYWMIETLPLKPAIPCWTWDAVPVYTRPASPGQVYGSPGWTIPAVPSSMRPGTQMKTA